MIAAATIRSAVKRYAALHLMSVESAELMPIKALLGWLEARERAEERERLAAGVVAEQRTEDRTNEQAER